MKYLVLVWAGLLRRPMRASLILLQIVVAFALFGVLQGLDTGIGEALAKTHANRLYVQSRVSLGDPLPLGLLSQIQRMPGVLAVTYAVYLSGTYQRPDQQIFASAVDAASFARTNADLVIPRVQLEAFIQTRTGAIVGAQLARRYGWTIGQRIPLQLSVAQSDGSSNWQFDLVGIYTTPDDPQAADYVYLNYAYLNEARAADRDTVSDFVLQIDDPRRSAMVGHDIDVQFANSSHETRTDSESNLAVAEVQRIGDIGFLAHAVTAAAFLSLLFAASTLMMQNVRERTRELAVLKTIGFDDAYVMLLVLSEAVVSSVLGAVLGLGVAVWLLPHAGYLIGVARLPTTVAAAGIGAALVLALISGAIPAWHALRIQVATALSGS